MYVLCPLLLDMLFLQAVTSQCFISPPNASASDPYIVDVGQNILGLSTGKDQSNTTKYWLKIEEVDASNGKITGR